MLRRSPGTERGNRKNVVLFVLESWTARHVGALGGPSDTTPFFDGLAREGALFDHFFANGLRTPEGIFSILCSFPNQPLRRILGRASSYLVRWRTLSEILAEVGWHLVDDGLTGARPLLCAPAVDPACRADTWRESPAIGETLKARLRAYLSLSQTLMYRDRVYPRRATLAFEDQRVRGDPVGDAPQW